MSAAIDIAEALRSVGLRRAAALIRHDAKRLPRVLARVLRAAQNMIAQRRADPEAGKRGARVVDALYYAGALRQGRAS